MLLSFLEHQSIPEVKEIIDQLIALKKRISSGRTANPDIEYESIKDRFEAIKAQALACNDAELANSQRVFREYFCLFCNLAEFKECLMSRNFRKSWDVLQDCLNNALFIGRFASVDRRLDIPDIVGLLEDYESLYPFTLFLSSEFVIAESHCSICGESMTNPSCPHRKGQLYRGEVAVEIIDRIKTLQAVCLVKNPKDKKCVVESIAGKPLTFNMLEEFLEMGFPWLQRFTIAKTIERRVDPNIVITRRNSPCTCGSGIKFKNCCGKKLYYDHLHCVVTPGEQTNLIML